MAAAETGAAPSYMDEKSVGGAGEAPIAEMTTVLKHANKEDADEALQAFENGEVIVIDEATNRRLLRKIDWNIMPIMCAIYGLQYLDKTTLSYASIMGLKTDTHLVGDQYSWLGSMFYFGYLVWEYPTNRLCQRLPLAKYSASNIIMWGLVLSCMAATSNFAGAMTVRFFLGVFESAVTPGFTLFTSQWYTKEEQGVRTGIWFSFNGWAQIVGGLIAYGIAVGAQKHGSAVAPWKIVFLVTGLVTVAVGCIFFWIMPDSPLHARFLSQSDRVLAVARIRANQQGVGNKHFKMYQLREALLDPMTWTFAFYALIADIPNGGLTNFFSQLITSFGFTAEQSLLYGTPAGAMEILSLLVAGYMGGRYGQRIASSIFWLLVAIVGMLLIIALPLSNNGGRLAGYYLTGASATPFVALLSMISTNVAGYTKKTTVAAIYLIFYCAGNIIGPQVFRPKDAPRYVPAEIVIVVCWGVSIILLVSIWSYYKWQNKKKAAIRASPGYTKLDNQEFLDLTDCENPEFIYVL